MSRGLPKQQNGFTLVELVAVIVLLGIVAVGSTSFIRSGMQIYVDTARRDNLSQQGRFAVERVSRELRNALPGSVRVSGACLEFTPIIAASSYLGSVADGNYSAFQAVDFSYSNATDHRVAIYPVEPQDVYDYSRRVVVDLADVDAVAASQRQVNLTNYTGPGHRFRRESPTQRFYIVTQPVSFCVRGNSLYRHSGYGWLHSQSTTASSSGIGSGQLLAEHIQTSQDGSPVTVFSFTAGSLQRAGSVHLDFRFSDVSASDEWMHFNHVVTVRNTP